MGRPVAPIRNLEELKKLLFIQRIVTQQAKDELLGTVSDGVHPVAPQVFMAEATKLLEKYVSYPTLSEFAANPSLANVYKWGATFGVTALIGGLILGEVAVMQPQFEPVLRPMFLALLAELDNPQHEYLIEPLEKALIVQVENLTGGAPAPEEAKMFIRQSVHELVEAFVIVCVQYSIMTSGKSGVALTATGKRILLHLLDAQKFIEELSKAHTAFQAVKPTP